MQIPFKLVLTRQRILVGAVVLAVLLVLWLWPNGGPGEQAVLSPSPAATALRSPVVRTPAATPAKTPLPVELTVGNMINLVNHARGLKGLPPLKLHTSLGAAAQAHANDMSRRGYFGHNSPEGDTLETRLATVGYNYSSAAENLGIGKTAIVVYEAWSNSPEHLANMTDRRFTDIGVGFAGGLYQGVSTTFVVVVFGSR